MRIGIDGGALSIADDRLKVGVYRVTYHLVKELQALNVKNDYRIYSFGRGERGTHTLSAPNTHFVRLIRPGYQKIWQTFDILKHPIDVYLGISQSVPLLSNILCDVKNIGFIYDTGYLEHPAYYPESANSLKRQTAELVAKSVHIITISAASKKAIEKAYQVVPDKVSVAYLGVDEMFTDRGNPMKRTHPYFLFVGSLKPGKNIPFMLRAFADVLGQSKILYDFVLIGSDYWLDPEISETIKELGIQDRVVLTGYVPDDILASYYRGAVALVAVSHVEGFGLPAVEAMACGCPVIVSTIPVYKEVIGDAGIFVRTNDRVELVRVMRKIIEDRVYRDQYAIAGKKQSVKFQWRVFARSVMSIIHDL